MELLPMNDTVFGVALEEHNLTTGDCLFKVVAAGPDCRELVPGDIAFIEALSGTMVTIYDTETQEMARYFMIPERNVLGVYRGEL